jgi:hypothetical protein
MTNDEVRAIVRAELDMREAEKNAEFAVVSKLIDASCLQLKTVGLRIASAQPPGPTPPLGGLDPQSGSSL